MKPKVRTIQNILRDPAISSIEKKVAVEKWKFNQLPESYRQSHIENVKKKINDIRKEANSK